MTDPLPLWNDTGTRRAIVRFVESVTDAGGTGFVPPVERVAVFDTTARCGARSRCRSSSAT